MLAVILKILSILGIILLVLLGIVILCILLILFMPIVYRIRAQKGTDELQAKVKIRWLFGLVRGEFCYPEPGKFIVKVLWLTVYDSGKTKAEEKEAPKQEKKDEKVGDSNAANPSTELSSSTENEVPAKEETNQKNDPETLDSMSKVEAKAEDDTAGSMKDKLFAKYEKIKYTIGQIYDKIKHILENITFYKDLLQDEDTKLLLSHAFRRLGKILRNIRPRRLKANAIFGTGSPDTTGYAYAVYGMLSPRLGKKVLITPDFTQKILEGNVYAAGHLTVFTLLVNVLAVVFDKRLRLLKHRLDVHKKKMKPKT